MSDEQQLSPQQIAADIAREFREDPSRWTRGAMARHSDGNGTWDLTSPTVVCWCLRGAIDKRTMQPEPVYDAFDKALMGTVDPNDYAFVTWNDRPGRTVAEVIALCEKVATS